MNLNKITKSSLALALLASSSITNAADIEANVALSTDYVFRGFSQTLEEPAISGGFDYSFDNGFYLGTWGSSVDFGSEAQAEIDLYGGYGFEIGGGAEIDLSYVLYTYSGESDLNYSEFHASVSFPNNFSLGVLYSPDYFALEDADGDDLTAFVINADYSLSLSDNWGLDFHVGYTIADEDDVLVEGDDYVDYSVALTTSAIALDFALTFYGTDIDDVDLADERVVFSISKSF